MEFDLPQAACGQLRQQPEFLRTCGGCQPVRYDRVLRRNTFGKFPMDKAQAAGTVPALGLNQAMDRQMDLPPAGWFNLE